MGFLPLWGNSTNRNKLIKNERQGPSETMLQFFEEDRRDTIGIEHRFLVAANSASRKGHVVQFQEYGDRPTATKNFIFTLKNKLQCILYSLQP